MRKIPVLGTSPGEAIIYIVTVLIAIGTINIFSASFVTAGQLLGDSYFFLKRHLISVIMGLVGLIFIARMNYRHLPRLSLLLATITVALLIAVHFIGVEANGARRWINLGIKFQPSEIAKFIAILMAADYLGPRIDRARSVTLLSWPVVLSGIMAYLVLKQPDMGTAAVIAAICLVLYLPSGIPLKQIYALIGISVTGIVYLVYAAAYRAERIFAWIDPWAYQQTSGYQSVQALLAIGSGGALGTGLGMGASKFHYLPEAHTDFAFAVLCQEMGFAGALLVIILFALLAWYGIKIALSASDGLGMMLAAGATFLIVGQAVGNIAMVTGILPVTGIPLPFISFGGTSLMVNLLAIGLLISVARISNRQQNASPKTETTKRSRRLKLVSRSLEDV
ncbi:MAG: ftsW 1 [Firmicutes bacterium]|nr:ftsW 1 [Bacillota bacterium]